MASVPNPPTFTVGQKLTAALMNTNVRDAVNFLTASPLCVVTNSATQSIANNATTSMLFDTESTDGDGMHSTVTNTDRLTAVTAGWYQVAGSMTFAANATGSRFASFTINGTTEVSRNENQANTVSARGTSIVVTTPLFLNVGDWVTFTVWQSSGGALVASAGARFSALWIHS